MKTIVAGSRSIRDYEKVAAAIASAPFAITEVVSGGALGVDRLGERWADEHHIPLRRFLADWHANPTIAGKIRNEQMADYAEALVAIWDGKSPGTGHMITCAQRRSLAIHVVYA